MRHPTNPVLLGVLLFLSVCISLGHAQHRQTMSLDGAWSFATDPNNRGEAEKWYQPHTKLLAMPLPGYAPAATGKICVPGIWDNQGYGTETETIRHDFVGKGWYKRQIQIPRDWAGRRVFLIVTGVSRYAKTWVNEELLGEHIGFLSTFEYDITKHVVPGQSATLTIQVDSRQRWAIDTMIGGSTTADYMDIEWGGIWGHVSLETRPDVWLSDLYVQPNVPDSSCSACATLNGKGERADGARLEAFDTSGRRVAMATVKLESGVAAGRLVSAKVPLPGARLWTPDSPTLYTARLSLLKGGEVLDTVSSRFGMRQFSVSGPYLLLNGKRLMLRGYGDDHIYPVEMAMPSDKGLHLRRLRTVKSYGFNHVRNHSAIMPPEYYDAADELGIIATAEFPIAYGKFIPGIGDTWKSRVPPGTDPTPAIETYKREWAAAIRQNRNHPSIVCWVMGNELNFGVPLRFEFQRIARQLDPARFFADTDGVVGNGWGVAPSSVILDPKNDRDTLDLYFALFDELGDQIDNPVKYRFPRPKKPLILHEAGNFITVSRPDLIDQFQHNFKPFWLTAGKVKLEKLGLLREAGQWAEKSEQLYLLCHKFNIESARKNPYVSGYHWWLFQDYWTTSNGIVDHYFRPKSIPKEEVLKINSEVVLLQMGLNRTYRSKNHLNLTLLVSNYSSEPLQGELVWEVKAGEQRISTQRASIRLVPQGELVEAAKISLELPETASPAKLRVTARLAAGKEQFTNDWSSWLYPAMIRPAAFPASVFADEAQSKQLRGWGVKPIPEEGSLSERAVYVVGCCCDNRLVDAMDRGASVVLLKGADQFVRPIPITYRTTWWKGGNGPLNNHCGTFVYDHPVTRAMAPDGWCDDGWFYLLEGARKFVLETAPVRPKVIVRALPSMAMVEDDALLFEVGVGKGSLIVSGLNHQQAGGRPENEWLIARLLEHAATFPQPNAKWPTSFVSGRQVPK
jgi:beta-galactosidase